MTTLPDRPNTALLVIDVQVGVVAEAHDRDAVVGRIGELVERARAEAVPVVWIQHSSEELPVGSEPWQYVPELPRLHSEATVHKTFGDSFEATDLEDVLAAEGVGRVVVAGAQTDACIRSTLFGAFARGYDVTLVADAHTTEDLTEYGAPRPAEIIAHTNLSWPWHEGPGRLATAVDSADLSYA